MLYSKEMFPRILQKQISASFKSGKSILLLGPRQTGKSTLIQNQKPAFELNLIQQSTFVEVARDPAFLEERLRASLPKGGLVFIDEIQRLPSVLNTVQALIDQKLGYQFALTGSSARKLKRGKANLLPGRVHTYELGSIIAPELAYQADTNRLLSLGSLPGVLNESSAVMAKRLLKSYATTYLNEEIKAEALTKNIEGFTRFLFLIAAYSTQFLDLTKISKGAAVPRQTVQRYFEILLDTLIIKRLDAFAKSDKRRLIQHPRFYFFDNGVVNALLNNFNVSVDRIGFLFENLFYNQLSTFLSYTDLDYRLSSYRTDGGAEVDLILETSNDTFAIEVKSGCFTKTDFRGFDSLQSFLGKKTRNYVVIPHGPPRLMGNTKVLSWQDFLRELE